MKHATDTYLKFAVPLLGLASSASLAAAIPPAPVFPAEDTVDSIQGAEVRDPYRGLENGDDPVVKAWSDAQNARGRAYLDGLPGRAAVAAKLARLTKSTSPYYRLLEARGVHIFALYQDPAKQQASLVMLDASADPQTRTTLIDPGLMDRSGHTAIDWYAPSIDGTKVAVSLSRNGSEDGTLHIYDAATAKEVDTPISHVQYPTAGGAVAWTADGKGFWYTRYPGEEAPETERHFNVAVYFHVLGAPASSDTLALSAKDGLPRTGEVYLDNRAGGKAVLASVQLGDGGQWQQFVLHQGELPLKIADYDDRVVAGAIAKDGTVYGLSRKDAPMGKVLKLSAPYTGGFAAAKTIVAPMRNAAIVNHEEHGSPLAVNDAHLFVTRIAGGPVEVGIYDLDGRHAAKLPAPSVATVNGVVPLPNGDAFYSVETFIDPPHVMRWSSASGQAQPTALAMTSPVSYADATVTQAFATSRDGTRVPLDIIARKGTRLDGHNPVLLYGYGGFGVNMTPNFSGGFRRIWLDAGGIYVVANLRGGSEYGDSWHRNGATTHKQNVFDDFAAAGKTLVKLGYTSHDKLALLGGSNGGLLMGATITQHPELARAVVSLVGIYDMIRVERDPNGAFNVAEFGTVKDPKQFKALYAYSPYHHVAPGTRYPAVLMTTGANDGRVNPLQSRKFTAALQAAQSDPDHPVLLLTSQTSGHGMGSSIDEQIGQRTDQIMFLIAQLGMNAVQAGQ